MPRSYIAGGVVVAVASAVATLTARVFAGTSGSDANILALTLLGTGWGGLLIGMLAIRLSHALGFGSRLLFFMGLGLLLLLANVAIAAALMFLSPHDLRLLLVLGGYALVASGVPALLAGRSLARRLGRLEVAAAQIATGELATRVAVDGSDEIARLAEAFNTMAAGLQEANLQRDALETSRRELFAAISHDLRTPLSSIRVMVDALSEGVVTDEETVARYLATMNTDIAHLGTLIDDLFELARIDAGALQLHLEPLSLGEILTPAVDSIRAAADRAGVLVRLNAPAAPIVRADPERMTRVLSNLLQNALRHTPPDGSVVVTAGLEGPDVVIAVCDSGEGIAPVDLPNVFERFYRGEKSRSRSLGGSGLGLSISRGIVEAHGGRIWVEATGGTGTTIKFTIPAANPIPMA